MLQSDFYVLYFCFSVFTGLLIIENLEKYYEIKPISLPYKIYHNYHFALFPMLSQKIRYD